MASTHTRPFRPKLTLRQMMKLVAFGAVASLCLAPGVRLAEGGAGRWSFVLLVEAVVIPLVLALVAFPLVRKGPLKDWLIRALLIVSVGVALAWAVVLLVWVINFHASRRVPLDYPFVSGIVAVIIVLGSALGILLRRVMPGRCPECQQPMLLPDAQVQRRTTKERVYQCLSCEGRFRKLHGAWIAAVPELDSSPRSP
jgi:hypothetical protein